MSGASDTPAVRPLRPRTPILTWVAISILWTALLIGGAFVVSGGFNTYYRYENHRGIGQTRSEFLGPDLRNELRAGERFVFAGEFDRNTEARMLSLYGLGAIGLIATAYTTRRRLFAT